jgi:hypothetical protein
MYWKKYLGEINDDNDKDALRKSRSVIMNNSECKA